MKFLLLPLFLACGIPLRADDITAGDSKFLADVLAAVQRKDADWLASNALLPMSIKASGGRKIIKDRKELSQIFTTELTLSVCFMIQMEAQKSQNKSWRGVWIGDGILWFDQYREKDSDPWRYGIAAIGHFAYQPSAEITTE